jgi:hypothetical protein
MRNIYCWDEIILSQTTEGQNSYVPGFVPGTRSTQSKAVKCKNHTLFFGGPPPTVGDNYVVAGQRLSIVTISADCSAVAAVSVGDNDDSKDEANKPSPLARTDSNGGG